MSVTSSQTGLTALCTYNLSGGLTGSCTASVLLTAQSNVTFTATYSGDGNFSSGTASTVANFQRASTSTALLPSPANPAFGQLQTFTATVTPQVAGTIPTGTVVVTTPGLSQPLCTVILSGGTGSCSSSVVPKGSNIVYQAAYSGDANFLASNGLSTGNTVGNASTTTTLALSSGSSAYGSEGSEIFTATVAPSGSGTPTGSVNILQGATVVCVVTLSAGTGTCSPAATALGAASSPFSVTAFYGGDASFSSSTSGAQTWTITPATAAEVAGVSTSTVLYGNESVATLSASLTSPGAGTPTGTVVFSQGGTTLCTATLVGWYGELLAYGHRPQCLAIGLLHQRHLLR